MIDLDKLQKKIDNLLESETSESMNSWLLQKRFANINTLLGEGSFISMSVPSVSTYFFNQGVTANFDSSQDVASGTSYFANAA